MWKLFGDVWAHSVFVSNLPGGANEERRVLPTPLTSLLQSFIDWHFGGKAAVWELKRTQESGGDRQWRSAVADVAAHRCSFHPKAHLSGEVTACLLAALCSDCSSSTCLVGVKNAQPPPCTAREAAPWAWQLWGTFAHSCVWVLYWFLEVEGDLLRQEEFLAALCCSYCLVLLLETVKMGFAKRQNLGVWIIEDNPADHGCEKHSTNLLARESGKYKHLFKMRLRW